MRSERVSHPRAWNRYSANFAVTEFYVVGGR
jgi:hypothetical protein